MSAATKEAINLMELLPESDQNFALEFIRKLVLAWDPDFTRVTPAERQAIEEAEQDFRNGEQSLVRRATVPIFILRNKLLADP